MPAKALAICTGCNLAVDVTWKYLNFFMNDDKQLKQIESEYGSGRMLTGEAKAELVKVFQIRDSSTYTAHCCAAVASNIMMQWQPYA